ncbi:hypothetical protein BJ684DRAFT_16651 [Piptocephalis cylindrospora]|uniref:Uncharacterized protein n=1 Tax=Piptocephalis cylindrospora TaxID=1907219 RepID=A0A4P9Y256_9FUNG|nr:hypothetical protein BJ684DRAFT_16651 [Piptocephalis cylindrospora]|eukprot:RKP12907.1 hypothetical protein BJ684DRAFT_16651 [Piptocephalis cylindrospora]
MGNVPSVPANYDVAVQNINLTFVNSVFVEPATFFQHENGSVTETINPDPQPFNKIALASPNTTLPPMRLRNEQDGTAMELKPTENMPNAAYNADNAFKLNLRFYIVYSNLNYIGNSTFYPFQIATSDNRCLLGSAVEGNRIIDQKRATDGACPPAPSQDHMVQVNFNTTDQIDKNEFLSSLWIATSARPLTHHLTPLVDLLLCAILNGKPYKDDGGYSLLPLARPIAS